MARISVKHANQQAVEYKDFSGGLNTSTALEFISMNELGKAVNVELDPSTGLLRTVSGTEDLYLNESLDFKAFFYDKTNSKFLLVDADKNVYTLTDGVLSSSLGTLTGDLFPEFTPWEDGVLIASGGHMQYYNGTALVTLANSPAHCNGVFVKTGRVWTYYGETLACSSVGDEETWASVSEVDSSGKTLDVGYKDTGDIVGVTNLSSDILIFKANGHAYHLYGDYPDWTLKEISRDIHCKGYRACCALANEAMVLSDSMLQSVTTTQAYGDMRASDVSAKVRAEIGALTGGVRLRYLPVLNQMWFVEDKKRILFLDCAKGAYFQRKFTTELRDVWAVGDEVYLLKAHRLQRLKDRSPEDEGRILHWEFWGKTLVSNNEYLVKRMRCHVTPEMDIYHECVFVIGKLPLVARLSRRLTAVYQDPTIVFESPRELYEPHTEPEYTSSEIVYANPEEVYESDMPLVTASMYKTDKRCVQRLGSVRFIGRGTGSKFLFNSISYEYVEV